jgi:hypothetical protein
VFVIARGWAQGKEMSEPKTGLASLGLGNAIRLRWVLRDIVGKRLKFSPIAPNDLQTLIDLGYIEMKDEVPRLQQRDWTRLRLAICRRDPKARQGLTGGFRAMQYCLRPPAFAFTATPPQDEWGSVGLRDYLGSSSGH